MVITKEVNLDSHVSDMLGDLSKKLGITDDTILNIATTLLYRRESSPERKILMCMSHIMKENKRTKDIKLRREITKTYLKMTSGCTIVAINAVFDLLADHIDKHHIEMGIQPGHNRSYAWTNREDRK